MSKSETAVKAPFSPITVANFFIAKASERAGIGHLKVQKLVYCAHGWWLSLVGDKPMLVNELPEAWKMGPVFPSLYHRLKSYSGQLITKPIEDYDAESKERLDSAKDIQRFLNSVWLRYEPYTGLTLVQMTHKEGGPRLKVVKKNGGEILYAQAIPNGYVKEEFDRISEQANA